MQQRIIETHIDYYLDVNSLKYVFSDTLVQLIVSSLICQSVISATTDCMMPSNSNRTISISVSINVYITKLMSFIKVTIKILLIWALFFSSLRSEYKIFNVYTNLVRIESPVKIGEGQLLTSFPMPRGLGWSQDPSSKGRIFYYILVISKNVVPFKCFSPNNFSIENHARTRRIFLELLINWI